MRHAIMSVHDVKAKAFARPFYVPTVEIGTRAFAVSCRDPGTELNSYPEDMFLYHLGWWDDDTGETENVVPPVQVCKAVDFVQHAKKENE